MAMSRQFELSESDFRRFSQLIEQSSGIYFGHDKAEVLRAGLASRARIVGAADLSNYYDFISNKFRGRQELRRLLEHLSVQETQFFRNPPQFEALRKYVIPDLVRRKAPQRLLRFWCAGCSTGEEPYTVAMSVLDVLPQPDSWSVQILGTDLSEEALRQANRGWYPERKLAAVDSLHRRRYFQREDGGYRVVEALSRLVRFQRHNLVEDPLPADSFGACDAIFCRNVIIYFTHETAKFVIEHFSDVMNPGGFLFLGHSETLWKMSAKYALVELGDAFIYRKPGAEEEGSRCFIPDRRLCSSGLPAGVGLERRIAAGDRRCGGQPAPENKKQPDARRRDDEDARPSRQKAKDKARLHIDRGEFGQAAGMLKQALESGAADAEIFFLLGLAHEKADELDEAVEDFRRALYLDANLSLAYFHLASVFEQTGRLKHAIREYQNAGRSFDKNPPGAWETELEAFDTSSLISLCRHKIETLKQSA